MKKTVGKSLTEETHGLQFSNNLITKFDIISSSTFFLFLILSSSTFYTFEVISCRYSFLIDVFLFDILLLVGFFSIRRFVRR
jgi:hypothetical protein